MAASTVESAVAEGGAYEVIRARLETQGDTLAKKAQQLNQARLDLFGGTEMALIASARIRTETRVADVFSLHKLVDGAEGPEIQPVPIQGSFLEDANFQRDFQELYQYYRESSLAHLRKVDGKLIYPASAPALAR